MSRDEKVTRFEVIDHRRLVPVERPGRAYVVYDVKVELSYQDDGRTLKVFIADRPSPSHQGASE